MEMRISFFWKVSCPPDRADGLARRYLVADLDGRAAKMGIACAIPAAMIDIDVESVTSTLGAPDNTYDPAVRRGIGSRNNPRRRPLRTSSPVYNNLGRELTMASSCKKDATVRAAGGRPRDEAKIVSRSFRDIFSPAQVKSRMAWRDLSA